MTESAMAATTPEDHQVLEASQVYERYLQGRLPEDEALRFERHYADCDYCLEQLETTEALLDGLRRAAAEDAARLDVGRRMTVAWYLRRRVAWGLAALGVFLAVWGGWRQMDLQHRLETLQAPTTRSWDEPLRISLAPLRSDVVHEPGESIHRLHLPSEPTPLHLTLPLALPPGGHYDVALTTAEGTPVWRLDGLGANAEGELRLTLPSTALAPGLFHLQVDAVEGNAVDRVARLRFEAWASESTASQP